MNTDEIFKKYKDELDAKPEIYDKIDNEWGGYFFYEKHIEEREKLHATAMECINKLLSPELKVFLRNLCSNKLGYPDEVIFYKAFGDNPEVGKSVSKSELEQKGIDVTEFEKMLDYWNWEGNCVEKQNSNGEDYYYLDSLCERADVTSEEEKERLNSSVELKLAIIEKAEQVNEDPEKYLMLIDDILLGITPQRLKEKKLISFTKEVLDKLNENSISLSKEALDWFESVAKKYDISSGKGL